LVKFFYYDTSYIFFFALIVYFIFILKGICVDEGSSLLRLFKPIEEFDLDCILKEEEAVEIEEEITHLTIEKLMDLANQPIIENDGQSEQEQVSSLSPQDLEIRNMIEDLRELKFKDPVVLQASASETEELELDFTHSDECIYDLTKGEPIKDLIIELGTNRLPRFQCCCHKLNVAVRTAIERSSEISDILRKLCRSNAHIRRSITTSNIFRLKKGKLRLANATRWSSCYLMLESVKRAFDKGCFLACNIECPVSLDAIELYLQILKPAYILTNNWQRDKAGIHDVLLGISKLLYELPRFNVTGHAKEFCVSLYRCINDKFKYELASSIYKVIKSNLCFLFYLKAF